MHSKTQNQRCRVAVLISGSGSNLQAIVDSASSSYQVCAVISNRPDVKGLERAANADIDRVTLDHKLYPTREAFDEVLMLDPDSAVSFANRAILEDRMGLYVKAIEDYERAIKMDPKLGEGLDWFTRFLQNRKDKSKTLPERVETLKSLMKKKNPSKVTALKSF